MEKINSVKLDIAASAADAPRYKCDKCKDTGWLRGENGVTMCECRLHENRRRLISMCGLTPVLAEKSFDNFNLSYYEEYLKCDNGNSYRRQAHNVCEFCRKYAASFVPGQTSRGILLYGDVGRGKTHLAVAVCNALLRRDIMPYFLVVPEFLDELRASYGSSGEFSESQLMARAMEAPLLVLDDLGTHNFSAWTVGKLFTLINHRVNYGLPFIITTNLSIKELQDTLGDRIVSRIVESCDMFSLYAKEDIRLTMNLGV